LTLLRKAESEGTQTHQTQGGCVKPAGRIGYSVAMLPAAFEGKLPLSLSPGILRRTHD